MAKNNPEVDNVLRNICLCTELRKAARELTRFYEAGMPSVELSPSVSVKVRITQFAVLKAMADLSWRVTVSDKNTPKNSVKQADLANYLHLDPSAICRNLKVLLVNQWVEEKSGGSGRECYLALTVIGRQVYNRCLECWQDRQRKTAENIDRHDLSVLRLLEVSRAVFSASKGQ